MATMGSHGFPNQNLIAPLDRRGAPCDVGQVLWLAFGDPETGIANGGGK